MNRLFRRDRPGSRASITGAEVATASEIIETLSIVTTIASASASMPKYGLSPLPSQTWPPSGASVSASTRVTAGSVRREGVTATPTPSLAHHRGKPAGEFARDGGIQPEPPVAAAHQHRDQRPPQMREPRTPRIRRRRKPRRGGAMQRRPRDHDVRPGQFVVPVHHDQVEAARVHARMLHLHHRPAASAQRRADRGRHAAAADHQFRAAAPAPRPRTAASGAGHSDAVTHLHGARGASTRSSGCSPAASARPSACA